jgi:hypothetical protein
MNGMRNVSRQESRLNEATSSIFKGRIRKHISTAQTGCALEMHTKDHRSERMEAVRIDRVTFRRTGNA